MGRLQRRLGPNKLGELREMRFEFSFNLIGKLTMDFLKAYHCAYSNRRCLADGLNQSVVSSVAQATFFLIFKENNILPTDTYIRASKTHPLVLVWLKHISLAARLIRSTTQIWLVTRHQYGTSTLVSLTLFRVETSGYVAKSQLFRATPSSLSVA